MYCQVHFILHSLEKSTDDFARPRLASLGHHSWKSLCKYDFNTEMAQIRNCVPQLLHNLQQLIDKVSCTDKNGTYAIYAHVFLYSYLKQLGVLYQVK